MSQVALIALIALIVHFISKYMFLLESGLAPSSGRLVVGFSGQKSVAEKPPGPWEVQQRSFGVADERFWVYDDGF